MTRASDRDGAMSNLLVAGGILALLAFAILTTEVAMTPPPLARGASPAASFAGAWKGFARAWVDNREIQLAIDLRIKNDGTVEGSIGSAQMRGRFERNRSWLGRKLRIRTDYIIVGQMLGFPGGPKDRGEEKMTMPMHLDGAYLKGSLFVVGRGSPARITLFRTAGPSSDASRRYGLT